MPSFSAVSRANLETCAPELQRLFNEVVKHWDCTVVEGKRSRERHERNLRTGATRTQNSKHVTGDLPSQAADVAPFPIQWNNYKRFYAFAGFVIGTAKQLGIPIRWGGDWDSDRDLDDQAFNDLVHFELVS